MKIPALLIVATLAFASSAAFAFNCPVQMKAIDEALPKAQLTDAQKKEVAKHRAEGETFHKAGKHQESIDALTKAKKVLGI